MVLPDGCRFFRETTLSAHGDGWSFAPAGMAALVAHRVGSYRCSASLFVAAHPVSDVFPVSAARCTPTGWAPKGSRHRHLWGTTLRPTRSLSPTHDDHPRGGSRPDQ